MRRPILIEMNSVYRTLALLSHIWAFSAASNRTLRENPLGSVIEVQSECFNWANLASGFRLEEEACQWWHNKNSVYDLDGNKQMDMQTSCLTVLDMNMHSGARYVGKIDYVSMSWGFHIKIFDCGGNFVGEAKEESSDLFLNSFRHKTVVSVFDDAGIKIGYSLRSKLGSTTLELQPPDSESNTIWMAVRKKTLAKVFCNNPEWTVVLVDKNNALTEPLLDPVYITALVSVEAMKETGKYDTCSVLVVLGIVLCGIVGLVLLGFSVLGVYMLFGRRNVTPSVSLALE